MSFSDYSQSQDDFQTPPQSPRRNRICPPPPCKDLISPPSPQKYRRPRSFGGIIRRMDGPEPKFLIVKGRRTGIWSFPKGHARKEEHPLDCAKREIFEETGYPLHGLDHPHPRLQRLKGGIYYLFDLTSHFSSLTISPMVEPLPTDTDEIEEARWVTREEMTYLIVNSGIKDFLERV